MSRAGIAYPDPPGGWLYTYTGNNVAPGTGGYTALDGTWSHDNVSDQWDGTGIGVGRPGGANALSESTTNFLRLQDTGDPNDHGMSDPGSNRKIMFGHSITADIGSTGDKILDDGITISFRARISTTGPFDQLHPDGGGSVVPWPAGGDGYVVHNGGKSNFSVRQSNPGGIISFALALQGEDHCAVALPSSGLIMNNLNGSSTTSNVGQQNNNVGTLNTLSLNPANWHEFWITIESDPAMIGTHMVDIYMDGSLVPVSFVVTAGDGADYADSYIALGVGSTPQSGALDIDFFSYKPGVHLPTEETNKQQHMKWSQPPIEINQDEVVTGYQLYANTFGNFGPEQLLSIDPLTGAGTVIGNISAEYPYGLSDRGTKLYTYDKSDANILELDPATGNTLQRIDIGVTNITGEGGLAFRSDGIGFLTTALFSDGRLWSFDITVPGSTYIGAFRPSMDGLDFDGSDVLYALEQGSGTPETYELYTINQTSGTPTLVGDTGVVVSGSVGGLTFAPDGTLYAAMNDSLYKLNPGTGAATLIGTIGFLNISGLTAVATMGLPTPLYCGWDEPSYRDPQFGGEAIWKIVADDFRCLGTMPVTSVHWWGSYLNWDIPEPPLLLPSAWRLGFWSNMPESAWSSGEPVLDPENIAPVAGGWGVLEVVNNGNMASVADAVKSLESNTGIGTRHTYNLFSPININDSSPQTNAQNFTGDGPYGVVTALIKPAGTVDDIAFLARGNLWIPTTGNWTFYINSDDGEELTIDYGALTIGSESWNDNKFGTVNLTAGFHDIQVIHREDGGGANVEVAATKGTTNNLYFFRLIGSGDPGLPATSSMVPGLVFDPTFTQSKPGESGMLTNLAQAQTAITTSITNGTAAIITDDRVNHSDPNNPGLGNAVFAGDHMNPWDVINGATADEDDSAILVEGDIWIPVAGTYYIGYNSDDGARLTINTAGAFPWLSISENVTGLAVIANTYLPGDTLQTDATTGKSWTVGQIFLPPGNFPFELLMFDRTGGFFVEMFGGTIPSFYDLIMNTGTVKTIPVPEVPPALMLEPGQPPVHEPRYSYPKELLRQFDVPAERVQQEFVGYDDFPNMSLEACFQYYVDLELDEWFLQNPYTDIQIPDPFLYYKLDGDASDSSGNGYHGTEYGGPTYVPGIIGQAIDLDGITDYVNTGYTTNLPTWTIAAWVTSPAAPASAAPSGPVHREKNYQINWNHVDPLFRGTAALEVGGIWYPASFGTLNANTWYHLSATYDGNVLKAYKNGVLITSNPAPSGNPTAEPASLKLGKHAVSAQYFAGSIDDVRIYDKVLSKEQIKTQMIGLMAHYKLDESSGLTAADSSCHGNHGKLSDGPTWQPAGGFHGGALLFDGIDDQVDCGSIGISGNADRTIGAWAKASTLAIPAWTTVFGFSHAGSGNDTYFDIESDNLGNYVLHTYGWEVVLCPVDLNWHHFAATHDGISHT
jgi:hypothetical protein